MALLLAACGTAPDDNPDEDAQTGASVNTTPPADAGGGTASTPNEDDVTSDSDQGEGADTASGEPGHGSEDNAPPEGPAQDGEAEQQSPVEFALAMLDALTVAAEAEGGYERRLFKHWADADRDGCDARRETLIAEAVVAPSVGASCALAGGEWVSRYDGKTTSGDGSDFDVGQMVPLPEAWESGAHGWDPDRRERCANDLGYEHSLIAVSKSSNRSKGVRDPAEWLPSAAETHCWYAAAWIHVKTLWDLAADDAEADGLRGILANCDDDDRSRCRSARARHSFHRSGTSEH